MKLMYILVDALLQLM